jgi:flagellar hook protein FlgE
MGIFDALNTAVSGLSAQSFALQNISGNIANSQTIAFKRINTQFSDLVGDNLPSQQIAGGVLSNSAATNNVQGDIQSATTSTFMGINGNGFFVVQKPTSFSGNQPVFGGVDLYTRRGDFQVDQNGFLVNGAGYFLEGIPVDPTTGNPVGSIPQTLQFSNNLIPAQVTSQIQYNANLPEQPVTPNARTGVPGSNLLNPLTFAANPLVGASQSATITGTTASLLPDAVAKGTGNISGLTAGTDLVSLGLAPGSVVSVTDGTNTTNYTVVAGDTIGTLTGALSGGPAAVNVSLVGGALQVAGNAGTFNNTVTISDNNTGTDLAALGFAAGNTAFQPTNLLTQAAVSSGQNMQVTVGPNPPNLPQTITFGTGPGQVSTLTGLATAIQALAGVNPAISGVVGTGDIKIVAANTTDQVTIGGTFDPTHFGLTTLQAFPSNGTVFGIDQSQFLNESIAGGSITSFDGTGTPVNMQFRWAKVDSASLGAGHTDQWNMFYQVNSNATNQQAAWQNVGVNFTFNSTGQPNPPLTTLTLNNVNVNGQTIGNVALVFGSGGLTQFSNTNGTVQVNLLTQNGASAGQLQSIAVDDQGRVVGTYSNGRTVPLAEVTLANFNGVDQLKQLDGGAFQATADSGPALFNATGKIVGSALEASNTDIADEFSKLIVTQQAYSANTRIITTTNTMVQDLLNVIR